MQPLLILICSAICYALCVADDEREINLGEMIIGDDEQKAYLYLIQGILAPSNWSFFELAWPGALRLILDSPRGDADLYLSYKTKHPGYRVDEHEMLSATCGLDVLDVPQSIKKPVFLGVYAHPSKSETTYNMLVVMLTKTDSGFEPSPMDVPADLIYTFRDSIGDEPRLRSRMIHEQMATIVNMTVFLRENPFPLFVNAAVLRLCEAFRDECNQLRLCIVRVMGECSNELRLVFSGDEVARRILMVSHSNDPLARSLTLQMLAKLAIILAENKQIHHLIVTSVDSVEQQERLAAVVAIKAFVGVSRSFSQTILEKLCATVASSSVSTNLKIQLVETFANMQADVAVIMRVFAFSENIVREACGHQIMLALFNSLTTLAISCRFAATELDLDKKLLVIAFIQFNLLIERLKVSHDVRVVCITILQNLKRLSSAVHMLTSTNINDLCDFGDVLKDNMVRAQWLATLVRLTAQNVHKINSTISEKSSRWIHMLSHRDLNVRCAAFHLFVNLYKSNWSPEIIPSLQAAFLASLHLATAQKSQKFFRLLTALVCTEMCPKNAVDALVDAVLLIKTIGRTTLFVLQFLVAAAEAHYHLYPRLHSWAVSKLTESNQFARMTLFACLLYAPIENLNELPANHIDYWGSDPWLLYLVARSAMRNGQQKLVAHRILQKIQNEAKSFSTKVWLSALLNICSGVVTDFTVPSVENAVNGFNRAKLELATLSASRENEGVFSFASSYAECMADTYAAFRSVVVLLSTNLLYESGDGHISAHLQQRICNHLQISIGKFVKCRDSWLKLYRRCFDADENTMIMVELYSAMCAFVSAALSMFVKEQALPSTPIPLLSHCSLPNKRLRLSIAWAKSQLEKLDTISLENRYTIANLAVMTRTLGHLCRLPHCIPRFVFQQLKSTRFKLNVLPQPGPHETSVLVHSNHQVPIAIEGAIESKHSSAIDSVIVKATAKFAKSTHKDYTQVQVVAPRDDKYFNTQFLLSFPQSCVMDFTVDFTDKETKRTWESGVSAELKINVS